MTYSHSSLGSWFHWAPSFWKAGVGFPISLFVQKLGQEPFQFAVSTFFAVSILISPRLQVGPTRKKPCEWWVQWCSNKMSLLDGRRVMVLISLDCWASKIWVLFSISLSFQASLSSLVASSSSSQLWKSLWGSFIHLGTGGSAPASSVCIFLVMSKAACVVKAWAIYDPPGSQYLYWYIFLRPQLIFLKNAAAFSSGLYIISQIFIIVNWL